MLPQNHSDPSACDPYLLVTRDAQDSPLGPEHLHPVVHPLLNREGAPPERIVCHPQRRSGRQLETEIVYLPYREFRKARNTYFSNRQSYR